MKYIEAIHWFEIQNKMEGYSDHGLKILKFTINRLRIEHAREYIQKFIIKRNNS